MEEEAVEEEEERMDLGRGRDGSFGETSQRTSFDQSPVDLGLRRGLGEGVPPVMIGSRLGELRDRDDRDVSDVFVDATEKISSVSSLQDEDEE